MAQVVQLLAGSNETRWKFELILNRNNDPAFAAAIEFRSNQASQRQRTVEFAGLCERVTASCCIDHEQCFVRRVWIKLASVRFTFWSSDIRFVLVCWRPAVSQIKKSVSRFVAA